MHKYFLMKFAPHTLWSNRIWQTNFCDNTLTLAKVITNKHSLPKLNVNNAWRNVKIIKKCNTNQNLT